MKKSGLTLIELLVIIAIIGILAGLLIPAVQKVLAIRSGYAKPLGDLAESQVVRVAGVQEVEGTYHVFLHEIKGGEFVSTLRIYSISTNDTVIDLEPGKLYVVKLWHECTPEKGEIGVKKQLVKLP